MKAVSAVVSGVVMVALVVIIASIISSFSTDIITGQTDEIANRTGEAVDCSVSNIDIVDVYMDFETNLSRVVVKNSGLINEQIGQAEIFNNEGQIANLITALPLNLQKGGIVNIESNISNTIELCGNFSSVKVYTKCSITEYTKTPSCI